MNIPHDVIQGSNFRVHIKVTIHFVLETSLYFACLLTYFVLEQNDTQVIVAKSFRRGSWKLGHNLAGFAKGVTIWLINSLWFCIF